MARFDRNTQKVGVTINWLDLSDDNMYNPDFEEVSFDSIKSTELLLDKYDKDLLKYFNSASQMATSEFKYIAYFQVLECIFDEVYLYETVQDAKSIIDSNWFKASAYLHHSGLDYFSIDSIASDLQVKGSSAVPAGSQRKASRN